MEIMVDIIMMMGIVVVGMDILGNFLEKGLKTASKLQTFEMDVSFFLNEILILGRPSAGRDLKVPNLGGCT